MSETKKSETKKKSSNRCPQCGFRRKGKNHDDGEHHKSGKHGSYNPA